MIQEAEAYKAEDDEQRDKVSAKNILESYAFNVRSTMEDETLKGKISEEERQKAVDKCNEVISWLDRNQVRNRYDWDFLADQHPTHYFLRVCFQTAGKDKFQHQQGQLEKVCNPIMAKLYNSVDGMPGWAGASPGPSTDEVD